MGRVFAYKKNYFVPKESFIPQGEERSQLDHYLCVKKQAMEELERLKLAMRKHDPKKADIFDAHQEILNDIVINEEIPSRILNERWAGDWAIYQVYETVLVVLKQTADSLIAERAADFEDVRTLLLTLWHGKKNEGLSAIREPVIIAANDLLPSDTASLDKDKVLAIITETGGVTSHTAIIAKSYGIPTVLGIQGLLDVVNHGQLAVLNADEGTVILDPAESVVAEYEKKYETFRRDRQDADTFLNREGCTADGVKIDIGLNIAAATDAELTAARFTDSAGLFRTEFLYMRSNSLPTEDEQISAYKRVLECFGEKPVILRVLDIGGDKNPSCIDIAREDNPFLGNRALRFCFSHPDIFRTHIRACLRSAVYGNLWIMFPMVSSLEDIRRAKDFVAAVREELINEGKSCGEVKIGIMVEVPSIALIAKHAAEEVDFASIGSNDLCQYLCAADRMNSTVESYYQDYHPALFRLIKETVCAFEKAGKPVSLCGELASDPLVTPVLAGLGLRKLSMGAASVATIKRAIASFTVKQAEETAARVLELSTAADVKEFLSNIR